MFLFSAPSKNLRKMFTLAAKKVPNHNHQKRSALGGKFGFFWEIGGKL